MQEVTLTKPWTEIVGLPLVALALMTLLTQCKSLGGIDPMADDGWEEVELHSLGERNVIFVSYRDAKREGSMASVSVRAEVSAPAPLYLTKEQMRIRSVVERLQFDCVNHAVRPAERGGQLTSPTLRMPTAGRLTLQARDGGK